MAEPALSTLFVAEALGEGLLIGLLVGAQREATVGEGHPGVRDFLLIGLVGAICGVLQQSWFTIAVLISITALLAVFHFQSQARFGITTEMAAVATFCFGYLTATPYAQLSIGMTIIVVGFLEAKQSLHKLVRETITLHEFNDTLRFLALIFVIYPLLPAGRYGPYGFFSPRQVWIFVILVSSVSYVGYFLTKFLGSEKGLTLTSILGGIASTTAATAAFAKDYREDSRSVDQFWRAVLIANAVLFPRTLLIIYAANPALGQASAPAFLVMCGAGLIFAAVLHMRHGAGRQPEPSKMEVTNPFRLIPALKFGAVFAAILFLSRFAVSRLGQDAVYWSSFFAGLLDVNAISLTLADLVQRNNITMASGVAGVLIAQISNAVVKTIIAAYAGSFRFGWRTALGFVAMFASGAAVVWIRH